MVLMEVVEKNLFERDVATGALGYSDLSSSSIVPQRRECSTNQEILQNPLAMFYHM